MPSVETKLTRELRAIRASFKQLARSFERLEPVLAGVARNGAAAKSAGRRAPRLTAQQQAALKLQGQYMGTMRGLKPRQVAKVKKIRAEKGIKAAITEAKRLSR